MNKEPKALETLGILATIIGVLGLFAAAIPILTLTFCDSLDFCSDTGVRVLFDGECPLCAREISMLSRLDRGRGAIDFEDIADGKISFSTEEGDMTVEAHGDEEAGGVYGAEWIAEHHWDAIAADYVDLLKLTRHVTRAEDQVRQAYRHAVFNVLAHNRDEEKEHAAMVLEWIRRRDPSFDKELKDFLFTDKPIAHD